MLIVNRLSESFSHISDFANACIEFDIELTVGSPEQSKDTNTGLLMHLAGASEEQRNNIDILLLDYELYANASEYELPILFANANSIFVPLPSENDTILDDSNGYSTQHYRQQTQDGYLSFLLIIKTDLLSKYDPRLDIESLWNKIEKTNEGHKLAVATLISRYARPIPEYIYFCDDETPNLSVGLVSRANNNEMGSLHIKYTDGVVHDVNEWFSDVNGCDVYEDISYLSINNELVLVDCLYRGEI